MLKQRTSEVKGKPQPYFKAEGALKMQKRQFAMRHKKRFCRSVCEKEQFRVTQQNPDGFVNVSTKKSEIIR